PVRGVGSLRRHHMGEAAVSNTVVLQIHRVTLPQNKAQSVVKLDSVSKEFLGNPLSKQYRGTLS
ncbi:hypothetical protein, partial [Infirmifilum sp.]|uniref:hypothetical protein n=1 Tax=Infirmifilum sp. TaxID=2856575 RepID=UPI003D1266A3